MLYVCVYVWYGMKCGWYLVCAVVVWGGVADEVWYMLYVVVRYMLCVGCGDVCVCGIICYVYVVWCV